MHSTALSYVREVLFPPLCYGCKMEMNAHVPLCASCYATLHSAWKTVCPICSKEKTFLQKRRCAHAPGYLSTLSYITLYDHSVTKGLIQTFKYCGIRNACLPFFSLLEQEKVNLLRIPADIVVPIPLHKRRERERGFNQAVLISEFISNFLTLPMHTDILFRRRSSPPQAKSQRRKDRERNVRGLFKTVGEIHKGASILLVDDVSTSGSTLEEAARLLVGSGAKSVHAFTLAREE